MTLPTFLGIGVPRSGTTWLHNKLDSHPDIYMPVRRKEIRFFDLYFDRGVSWYESFFPSEGEARNYQAIGEISPEIYRMEGAAQRVYGILPYAQLIILMRHPVDRAYSSYGLFLQRRNYTGDFREFVNSGPLALGKGYYSQYIREFLRYYDRERILPLISEEVFADVKGTEQKLANFLGVDPGRFPENTGKLGSNASTIPRARMLHALGVKIAQQCNRWGMDYLVDIARQFGVEKLLTKGAPLPPLDPELKQSLSARFVNEFYELENLLHVDLSCWRQA